MEGAGECEGSGGAVTFFLIVLPLLLLLLPVVYCFCCNIFAAAVISVDLFVLIFLGFFFTLCCFALVNILQLFWCVETGLFSVCIAMTWKSKRRLIGDLVAIESHNFSGLAMAFFATTYNITWSCLYLCLRIRSPH